VVSFTIYFAQAQVFKATFRLIASHLYVNVNVNQRVVSSPNPNLKDETLAVEYAMPNKLYSIRDMASEFKVTTRTIRYYEEKGLLSPDREGAQRIYSPSDRTKLKLILRGKRLGLSLDESAEIVMMYGSPEKNRRQLERLIERIRVKRQELMRQKDDLESLLVDLKAVEKQSQVALAEFVDT
jgi:DNA-binding transcriptional MerR regulator